MKQLRCLWLKLRLFLRLMLRSMHLRGGSGEGRRREGGEALANGQTGGRGAAEAQMLRAWGARCRGSVGRGARRRAARRGCVCVLVRPRQGTRRRTCWCLLLSTAVPVLQNLGTENSL